MREGDHAVGSLVDHEAGVPGGLQCAVQLFLGLAGDRTKDGRLDIDPDHRRGEQHLLHVYRQRGQPAGHGCANSGRQLSRSIRVSRCRVLRAEQAYQLPYEQGVPAAAPM